MKSGGIMWEGPAVSIPIQTGDENSDQDQADDAEPNDLPWSGASLTKSW